MSAPGQLPDADDIAAARELSRAQRDLELQLLATEARIALNLALPILSLLPAPAVRVVEVVRRLVSLV